MKNKGFTLIELLAIMVVLGVIMAFAIPNTIKMLEKNKRESFVAIVEENGVYKYYVTLVACNKENKNSKENLKCAKNQDIHYIEFATKEMLTEEDSEKLIETSKDKTEYISDNESEESTSEINPTGAMLVKLNRLTKDSNISNLLDVLNIYVR